MNKVGSGLLLAGGDICIIAGITMTCMSAVVPGLGVLAAGSLLLTGGIKASQNAKKKEEEAGTAAESKL